MRHILVYGVSIALVSLANQLHNRPGTNVICCNSLSALGDLAIFSMMIIDFNDTLANDSLALLRIRPDLPVVGINTSDGTVTILSGQVFLARSLEDVITCLARIV